MKLILKLLPPITILSALAMALILVCACDKKPLHWAELEDFYAESLTLPQQQTDSIDRFDLKLVDFAAQRPEARNDHYYQLIIANIQQARLATWLLNSPEWVKY